MHNGLIGEIYKANYFAQDAGAKIAQIRWLTKEIKYHMKFKLVKINKKIVCRFGQKLLECLLKRCDTKAREVREKSAGYE